MKKRKLLVMILAGFMAAVLAFGLVAGVLPYFVNAKTTSSELKQQLDALKEEKKKIDKEISKLEDQLSDNLDDMEKIVAQKDTIDQEIFQLHQQVDNINQQIAAYSTLIADKQDELDVAEARLKELNEKNKERIRAMEEDGTLSYWSVLFQANDFADLLDRLNIVEEIAAADQRRLKEMSEAAQMVADTKASLEAEKTELEVSKQELEDSQAKLEAKSAEADKLLADLVATGAEYEALIEEAEKEAGKLKGEISDAQDAYDDAKYKEWLATSVPPTTSNKPSGGSAGTSTNIGGIKWLTPCSYRKVSSPFGWRIHPVYGDRRFHYGIDLSAPKGEPIIATRSGVVTVATYSRSAGYYVTVDHQDGFESKYLHMTHYVVKKGDYVTAGQVIGYVGSTGVSTGAHLHFSILYNGSHVNPANYIKF